MVNAFYIVSYPLTSLLCGYKFIMESENTKFGSVILFLIDYWIKAYVTLSVQEYFVSKTKLFPINNVLLTRRHITG